jgi:RNA polymerase sigma-70 factor (ECF subfamily)
LRAGDLESLRAVLTADVTMTADSGGKAPQWSNPVFGSDKVARVLVAMIPPLAQLDVSPERHRINGHPGAIFRDRDGKVLSTWALDVVDGQVQAIRTVLNPEKLTHVGVVGDAWAVRDEANELRRRGR